VSQSVAGAPGGSLQFERADRASPASGATCKICSGLIASSYYVIGGEITCQRCRNQLAGQWNRRSPGARFAKALGLGLAAAVIGAGLHFGIAALTGYEFGLIAVVVGLLVGTAVRKGSDGRGGRRYQLLAVFLTYTAVVVTDSSMIARELLTEQRAQADSVATETGAASVRAASPVTEPMSVPAGAVAAQPQPVGLLGLTLGLALMMVLAYAAPIMIGIASPLHLLIAGFALYEAWKLNRGIALSIAGPYQATGAAPA
jgi:hypothetical protein